MNNAELILNLFVFSSNKTFFNTNADINHTNGDKSEPNNKLDVPKTL